MLQENKIDFTDIDYESFRSYMRDILKSQIVTVTFTKKDGTERVMKCTLRPDLLPIVEINEEKKVKKINDDIVAVFDLEANGWRSFNIKSVTKIYHGTL